MKLTFPKSLSQTLSWRRSISYRNQSIDLFCKSANQWTGFYMIGTSVVNELTDICKCLFVLHSTVYLFILRESYFYVVGARFTNLYFLTYIRNDKELYHKIGNTILNSKFIFLNVLADTFIRNFAKAILLMTEAYSKPCQYIFLQNAPS